MHVLKTIIVGAILLAATQARATSQTFNIFFGYLPGVTETGQYTVENGVITAFHATVGHSIFDTHGGPDPFDLIASDTGFGGEYDVFIHPLQGDPWITMTERFFTFENRWVHEYRIHTPSAFDPTGLYWAELASAPVPERSPAWLVLIGIALIAARRVLQLKE